MKNTEKSGSTLKNEAIKGLTKPKIMGSDNSEYPNKRKFALWIYPETLESIDTFYKDDCCRSRSEFIEKAIRFYIGYLKQEGNINYLAPIIKSMVGAMIDGTEMRISRNLFKMAVELSKLSNITAAVHDVDKYTLNDLQSMCVEEVKSINGAISFEKAFRFQKSE